MIFEGLKLLILGMGMVYLFLILLFFAIVLSGRIMSAGDDESATASPRDGGTSPPTQGNLTAVISSAIAAHRRNRNGRQIK